MQNDGSLTKTNRLLMACTFRLGTKGRRRWLAGVANTKWMLGKYSKANMLFCLCYSLRSAFDIVRLPTARRDNADASTPVAHSLGSWKRLSQLIFRVGQAQVYLFTMLLEIIFQTDRQPLLYGVNK